MLAAALSEPAVFVPVGDDLFDRPPHLLNTPTGTIDLRTGRLREHRADGFLTKLCPTRFDPASRCPRFDRFVREVFPDEPALATYVLRVLGYALTGEVSDQAYYLFDGSGSNAKTLFLETVQTVLGPGTCTRCRARCCWTAPAAGTRPNGPGSAAAGWPTPKRRRRRP